MPEQLVTVIDLTMDADGVVFEPDDVVKSSVLPLLAVTAAELLDRIP